MYSRVRRIQIYKASGLVDLVQNSAFRSTRPKLLVDLTASLVDLTLRAPYGTTVAPTAALLHIQSIIYVFGQHAGARVDGWRKTFQESLRTVGFRSASPDARLRS